MNITKYGASGAMLVFALVELFVRHSAVSAAADAFGAVVIFSLYQFWLARKPKPVPVLTKEAAEDPGEEQSV